MQKQKIKIRANGMGVQHLCTLDAVAKELGVSRVMAGHIERKALKKLKKALFMRGLDASDFFEVLKLTE